MESDVEMEIEEVLVQPSNLGEIGGAGATEVMHHYQTMFPELYQVLTATFAQNKDIPAAQSDQVVVETLKALATYQGGRAWYLGRSDALDRSLRDVAIYRLQGKLRNEDIAIQFGITSQQARSIAKRVTKNRSRYGLP